MDLRALLFSSDGSSTATLCQVLTDLGIEAEICSEILVATQRVARENYDAIIVDWDLESDAMLLLKTAREQKAIGLNLALVPDDTAIARALQHGANSVIKKPVAVEIARDTLSTARDLILSRRTEQREKEARLVAVRAEAEAAPEFPSDEPSAPKTGFLSQTMTRSALEAEEKRGKPDTSGTLGWQAARGPASLHDERIEGKEIQPVTQKRWDEVKTIFRDGAEEEEKEAPFALGMLRSHDKTGVFSSLPDEPEAPANPDPSSLPPYLVPAMVACLLVAGVLYVWAPGDSYLGRMTSTFHAFSVKSKSNAEQSNTRATVQPAATEKPASPAAAAKAEEMPPDPGPVDSTDVDPSKIQIIEAKAIPKAGAQQPPTTAPPPDSDQAKALAQSDDPPAVAPTAPPEPESKPVPVLVARPHLPPPAPARVVENPSNPSEKRVGVIIPDSLRNTPAPSPASALEPPTLPEETALSLLIYRADPDYPAQALQQHMEGPVILQAWISKDGSVRDLKLVKGYFVLGRAALETVKQWKFRPYVLGGKALDFQTSLTVNFKHPN